jgi:hypothetical protein
VLLWIGDNVDKASGKLKGRRQVPVRGKEVLASPAFCTAIDCMASAIKTEIALKWKTTSQEFALENLRALQNLLGDVRIKENDTNKGR